MRYRDRSGTRCQEPTGTADWNEAQRKLRERLQARDEKVLAIVRKGEHLLFNEGADFFLENYSKPPMRAPKTHVANVTALNHLRPFFGTSRLSEMGSDHIEGYLRTRLKQRKRVKRGSGFAERGHLKPTTVHQEFRVLKRILNVAVKEHLITMNPCAAVEFPVVIKGLFRPRYMTWSEQQQIEFPAPRYLRNVIRIIAETGLRVYKELAPMRKDQVDLVNKSVWIPDSKTPNGIADVPLTEIDLEAFRDQISISGNGPWLFPSVSNRTPYQQSFQKTWRSTLRKAGIPYFRLYDLRSTYATRRSAGGVADEWVTQLLRQGASKVFKKYSQMKLQMKREALEKLKRQANETKECFATVQLQ